MHISLLQILSPVTFPSLSNGLISRFLSSTCTEVSGVENIGQCGRLSQLSWLLGAHLLTYLLTSNAAIVAHRLSCSFVYAYFFESIFVFTA